MGEGLVRNGSNVGRPDGLRLGHNRTSGGREAFQHNALFFPDPQRVKTQMTVVFLNLDFPINNYSFLSKTDPDK